MAIKVLYVITDSGIGGSEKTVANLIDQINPDVAYAVGVVVLKNKREMAARWENKRIPVYALGMGKIPGWGLLKEFQRIIEKHKPDVVHSFLFHAIQLCRLNRIVNQSYKLVSSPRINYRFSPHLGLWIDRFLKHKDDVVLSESTASKEFLKSHLHYNENRIRVITNGVDIEIFKFSDSARTQIRNEFNVGPNEILIGTVGRYFH